MEETTELTDEQKKKFIDDFIANQSKLDEIIDDICYAGRYNHFDEVDKGKQHIKELMYDIVKEVFSGDKRLPVLKKKIRAL